MKQRKLILNNWRFNEGKMGIILILPLLIYFLIFQLGPMLIAFIVSFTEWNLRAPIKFTGIENYKNLFFNKVLYPAFWPSLLITLKYIIINVPGSICISCFVAALLNSDIRGEGFFKTAFYIPNVTAGTAVAAMWVYLLDPYFGLINKVLGTKISWLGSVETALPSLAVMGIWGAVGFQVLLLLASMKSIPQTLYEAARMDGAKWRHTFLNITIPMIRPTIFFLTVTGLISGFQVFEQMYLMTSGGPSGSTTTYMFYLYNHAFRYYEMGTASAMSYILLIIILIITLLQFKFVPQTYDK